jgi:hypothetical protein
MSVRQATTTIRSANVVVGNLTAGNISTTGALGGTLSTAAQPTITSVGTLSTLTVGGNMTVDGNLFVQSGRLSKLDNCLIRSFRRSLINTVGSAIEIFDILGNGYVAELCVVQDQRVSKMYRFAIAGASGGTGSAWHRLVPLTSANASDIIVEINHQDSFIDVARLRIVRVALGAANNIECTLTVFQSGASGETVTITPVEGTYTSVAPSTIIHQNALIAQVSGNVGIRTDTPTRPLDVVGAITTNAAYQIGGALVLNGTTLGTGVVNSSLTSVGNLTSLNVTGNVTGGNISTTGALGGTLSTAAQLNITSVGTLASLAVAGNVAIDTNTLVVDSVANRVGIVKATPLHPLDVTGNINSTGSLLINNTPVLSATALGSGVVSSSLTSVGTLASLNVTGNISADGNAFVYNAVTNRVGINYFNQNPAHRLDVNGDINTNTEYRIGGTIALEADRLGTGVVSSSLTSVGNLTTLRVTGMSNLQNMTVAGDTVFSGNNIDFGTYKSISLKRSMTSNTLGAGVEGGGVIGGAYKAVVSLLQDEDVNNRIAKSYEFVIDKWSSNGTRERAIPRDGGFIDTTADYNDLGLDVAITSGSLNFAVVRTRTGSACSGNNITVAITAYYPKDQPVTFNADSGQLAPFIAPTLYRGNQLLIRSDQNLGSVGIGTDSPRLGAKLDVNGVFYGRGAVVSDEFYVGKGIYIPPETGIDSTGINFANVWRLWYNPSTGNLEIHKNNTPEIADINWTPSNYTVTAILAAQ